MPKESTARGTLYLVATPIGNLQDITLRAIDVLKEVDVIACEDTRHTQKLLTYFGISKPTVSYHDHNERERAMEMVAKLKSGQRVAVVSDAGMPGICDPGYRVVALAVQQGVRVVPVPGASALVLALAASGLPADAFGFGGFLPSKSGQRREVLEEIAGSARTETFYEAPHRIVEALEDLVDVLGGARRVVVARELTKLHEEFLRGRAAEVLANLKARGEIKGEITLLIGKADETAAPVVAKVSLRVRMEQVMREESLDEKAALKKVAKEFGLGKSEAYRQWQRGK
jgi:16S rRNA (cytidine1402-2'-O)-methyltransferase